MDPSEGFSPPADLNFTMGETEKKMDMTLDEIIKLSKKKINEQRISLKDRNTNSYGQPAKPSRQKLLFSRASVLRQAKLAEARSRNGNERFVATEAAARKARFTPIGFRINRNRSSRKFGPRPQLLRAVASARMKISVANSAIKNGARLSTATCRSIPWIRQPGGVSRASSKMELNYKPKKLRTLDSLFASLKEQRIQHSQNGLQGIRRSGRSSWFAR